MNYFIKRKLPYMEPYFHLTDKEYCELKNFKIIHKIKNICTKYNCTFSEFDSLIDFGCGGGEISLGLSYHFPKVFAFDESEDMLNKLIENIIKLKELDNDEFDLNKIEFKKKDFTQEIEIQNVKLILLRYSIHFADIKEIDLIMTNFIETLTKNGLIIIIEPWIKATFGNPELNQKNNKRTNKIKKIIEVKQKLEEFLNQISENKISTDIQISEDLSRYSIIIQKKN